ncbi:MAG: hypothetical protein K1X42_16105 [Opitutaceae bacterium]|nr:hypothetical protein [Opitutaceae bacterium]
MVQVYLKRIATYDKEAPKLNAIISLNPRALDACWSLAGIFSGGILGLFLLGSLSREAGRSAAIIAVTVGVLVILWMSISPDWHALPPAWRSPFHGFLTIVFGTNTLLLTVCSPPVFSSRSRLRDRDQWPPSVSA